MAESDDASSNDATEEEATFDPEPAHRAFSVQAFNSAWDLIEKTKRSDAENEEMISLAHSSAWHWSKRSDVRAKNRAISAWQLSRVYTEAGLYDEAQRYADRSLEIATSEKVGPVFVGYAYEALARLANETERADQRDEWLTLARAEADKIDDEMDRDQLLKDLDALG